MKDSELEKKDIRGVVTVLLQDYFHRGVFRTLIGEKQWSRFQSRLEKNVEDTLQLLDEFKVKATFFTLGWIAEKFPSLIKRLADQGHEIASAGYWARAVSEMNPTQFREDIRRANAVLQSASGKKVVGYRCAYRHISDRENWALSILIEEGYLYDASYRSPLVKRDDLGRLRVAHQLTLDHGVIWEFPLSTKSILGFQLPISGGNYLRQLPHRIMFNYFKEWIKREEGPFVLYFHPWELDEDQPVINAIGPLSRMKQYRNLGKMRSFLPSYFSYTRFVPVREYLGIDTTDTTDTTEFKSFRSSLKQSYLLRSSCCHDNPKSQISVVIPCYNEESSLPYLENALAELEAVSKSTYEMRFVFVDDCSTDKTLAMLEKRFGNRPNCKIVSHDTNKGVASAISTGIQNCDTEVVCSMDADCSYDPLELVRMIPELDEQTDLVTASPYHPQGFVLGVPGWRLFLSKSLSRIYHMFLQHKLSTYTSCFRVYRKSAVEKIHTSYGDFKGIVELLALLDTAGSRIKEYPTTLQSRIFGYSKMNTLATICGHLRLLIKMYFTRKSKRPGRVMAL